MADPIGLAIGAVSALGGLLGRRSAPKMQQPSFEYEKSLMREQAELSRQLYSQLEQIQKQNLERYQSLLPAVSAQAMTSLRGLGYTTGGEDLGIRSMASFGMIMREAQRRANAIRQRLIQSGVPPEQADLIAENVLNEAYQNAIAQGEQMNMQRIGAAQSLLQNLLGATQYQPSVLGSLYGATSGAAQNLMQMLAQLQQRQAEAQAEYQAQLQQQRYNMLQGLAQTVGYMYGQYKKDER